MKTCSGAKFFNYFKTEYLTWRIICTLQYILTKSEWTEKLSIFLYFCIPLSTSLVLNFNTSVIHIQFTVLFSTACKKINKNKIKTLLVV